MRRDLVQDVLDAAAEELFEDVLYTHAPAGPVTVSQAIFGVEIVAEREEWSGQAVRGTTHTTRALKAKFPNLTRGDLIDDGVAVYRVLDFEPVGDGRFEVLISLVVAG
ncbi:MULTISPECIES: hypothetical protein [unclassified Devosia]|uniref:head-tail joining protein n=1 Tax=unclassified Devosia TaxID=196773 RepID=UPI001AC238A2|nr:MULTISPECIES: hypothetical protein [unclassified Devosia]MBN9304108.1 hypothetical protein [Devosia sp.]